MAYDRYDNRRGRDGWRGNDHRDHDRGGRRDERGFFERAGDEISSWFGDESSGGRDWGRERDHDRGHRARHHDRDYSSRDERNRERGDWFSSESDRDRRPAPRASTGRHDRWGDDGRDYRPMTGDYGRSQGRPERSGFDRDRDLRGDRGEERIASQWDHDEYRRTGFAGSTRDSNHDDAGYHEARRRHMEEFDRDYDDYRRERQSRFEDDFGGWREQRQSKRQLLGRIREHMEVVGNDDEHVGTVDRVAGDRIILTKSDPEAGGVHHSLTCTSIDKVEDDRVILDCSAEQARKRWRDESRERALFEREDQGHAGPHMLDRSFSGTYR